MIQQDIQGYSAVAATTEPTPPADRIGLVLDFARVLYVNGQATDQTLDETEQVASALGLRIDADARWDELQLQIGDDVLKPIIEAPASPSNVDMMRVAAATSAIKELLINRLSIAAATQAIYAAAKAPPLPTWLFMFGAAGGAVALAIIFGIEHLVPAAIIFVSAFAGAGLRRVLARHTTNLFVQPFCAALLAGLIGALAVRYQLSSSLRLVCVCPCMILVPGPHLLNSALDLIKGRIHLGAARGIYATLVIVAITMGLLCGLALLGTSLPVEPVGRAVPLWEDVLAAGVAVAAYSIFFSTPLRMLPWPVSVGMLAHALRWVAISVFSATPAVGALVACIVVGIILTPISRRSKMPFAAIGFASVVSMMPGVFIFRMASGLEQIASGVHTTLPLISGAIADAMTATTIILAMSFGLVVPKLFIDYFVSNTRAARRR